MRIYQVQGSLKLPGDDGVSIAFEVPVDVIGMVSIFNERTGDEDLRDRDSPQLLHQHREVLDEPSAMLDVPLPFAVRDPNPRDEKRFVELFESKGMVTGR